MPKDIASDAVIQIQQGQPVELPNGAFVANAAFERQGEDLHMTSPDGQSIVIEDYFMQNPAPDLVTADGAFLPPEMVDAFLPPQYAGQYAQNASTMTDVSPAGKITEIMGEVTITRADGTKVVAEIGTVVMPGDVIETSEDGAANILFADNTTFAISESARLSVDEFTYSAAEQSGSSFFSMLQGMFVYTSGLIGKNDPGNVNIETPVGSIGIRGTVVAGDINPAGEESTITIVDGAIVLTNGGGTLELNDSFETASLTSYQSEPVNLGQISTDSFTQTYDSVAGVAGSTFTSLGGNTSDGSTSAPATASDTQEASPESEAGTAETQATSEGEVTPPPPTTTDVPPPPPPSETDGTQFNQDGSSFDQPSGSFLSPPPPHAVTQSRTTTRTTATGSTSTTTAPTPAPPPPQLNFQFSPYYTKGTTVITDDGIPVFGGAAPIGQVIGAANLMNVPASANIVYNLMYKQGPTGTWMSVDASGDIFGKTITYDPTPTPDPDGSYYLTPGNPIFNFDFSTGVLRLINPLGMTSELNGGFVFRMEAIDTSGGVTNTVATTNDFVLRLDPFNVGLFNSLHLGAATNGFQVGTDANDGDVTFGTTGTGGLTISTANQTVFTGAGNDRVLHGSSNAEIFLGSGNDLALVNNSNFGRVDGGLGVDRVILSSGATAYDFTNTAFNAKLSNVEVLEAVNGRVITLSLENIFNMTDINKTLTIKSNNTGQTSTLNIDIDQFTVTGTTTGSVTDTGVLNLQGTYNGQTVTLIIDQGTASDGIIVNNI